jgi:alpha-1,3-mannosyltransferase
VQSVLHVCTDFWPSTGGIQQFVLDLARHSATIDIRASVLCFNRVKGHPGNLPEEDTVDGVAVKRIPFLDFKYYKPALVPWRFLRKFDLIHVHGTGAPLDLVALTKGLHGRPVVLSTHGGIFHTATLSELKRLYFYGFQRLTMRYVDAVAACSRSDATLFEMISDKVQLLENAVSVRPFLALPLDKKERGVCLFVGRLAANKGIDALLRAFAAALQGGADGRLRIVGPDADGNLLRYKALAQQLAVAHRVAFVGRLDQQQLLEEYARADVFVSASRYEGFGLSAIEAKASGCRLLLHQNDAYRTLFDVDSSATLVNFDDALTAGSALRRLLEEPSAARLRTRREETQVYSWEKKIVEWSLLYRRAIAEHFS